MVGYQRDTTRMVFRRVDTMTLGKQGDEKITCGYERKDLIKNIFEGIHRDAVH